MPSQTQSVVAFARHTDPDTSWEAAASVSAEQTDPLKAWILQTLNEWVLADHELVVEHVHAVSRGDAPRVTAQRVRTARQELAKAGLLEKGEPTRTPAGRPARTWMAAL